MNNNQNSNSRNDHDFDHNNKRQKTGHNQNDPSHGYDKNNQPNATTKNAAFASSLSNATKQNLTVEKQGDITVNPAACMAPEESLVNIDESHDPYLPFREATTGYWNDPEILQNQLLATFPSEQQALQTLPPYKYEQDFKKRLQLSYSIVIDKLQADLARHLPAASPSDDDDDDDDSCYDDTDDSLDRDRMDVRPTNTTADPLLAQRILLQKVAEHPAVHFGFQCLAVHDFDMWCACPMGEKLKLGRSICSSNARMRPKDFMAHLNQHASQGIQSEHGVVCHFLECLYSNVYQDNNGTTYPHEAVAKNEAQRQGFQRLQAESEYSLLHNGISVENDLMDQFQLVKLQLEETRAGVEDDLKARRMYDEMKRALEKQNQDKIMREAFMDIIPAVTEGDGEQITCIYEKRVQALEKMLAKKFDGGNYNVILPCTFNMRKSFKEWRKECVEHKSDFSYECNHCYLKKMLLLSDDKDIQFDPEVTYAINFRVNKDGAILARKESSQIFLSEVWSQLESLFFEWNQKQLYFEPLKDKSLEEKRCMTRARQTYRAIGRLIAFALDHGIKVPRSILPPFLWVHLFRAADFNEFDNSLHCFALSLRANSNSDVHELCKAYGIAPLQDGETFQCFSQRIYPVILDHAQQLEGVYRSSRSMSWDGLKEGFDYSKLSWEVHLEYAPVLFHSKQKNQKDLDDRMSSSVRECVANDPWATMATILAEE
ncbi:hypothetical protein FisN_18Lh168 [Fistulifera solaris]|uniref:Uncharacterized protein n=1 Tax=Fistulifera solaris TaxID=1519565 RepID=A0A1Z5JU09_FISSO|nr:hypothetical protein FisN_18Lh168 [Fistulifera solaris]|eukprot:GAX17523.1 hypothetical protein FisN_18Lh168 [Fistulifera solaris]